VVRYYYFWEPSSAGRNQICCLFHQCFDCLIFRLLLTRPVSYCVTPSSSHWAPPPSPTTDPALDPRPTSRSRTTITGAPCKDPSPSPSCCLSLLMGSVLGCCRKLSLSPYGSIGSLGYQRSCLKHVFPNLCNQPSSPQSSTFALRSTMWHALQNLGTCTLTPSRHPG
jgi:hypothetical protein